MYDLIRKWAIDHNIDITAGQGQVLAKRIGIKLAADKNCEESKMKIECPWCKRFVGAYTPKDGDGSALRFRPHKNMQGEKCVGSSALYTPPSKKEPCNV